jgi:cytochrome P450
VADMTQFTGWITLAMTPIHREGAPALRRQGQQSLRDYLEALLSAVATDPGDSFISRLLRGSPGGPSDVLDLVVELVFAGYLTTAGLIVNACRAVLLTEDARDRIARHPVTGEVVDEMMRFDGPAFRGSLRFAAEDVATPAGTIPRGGLISVMFAATNRDPDVYHQPDRLCFTRAGEPEHLGFSHGAHKCWGAPVARMEVAETLTQLFRAFPRLRLEEDPHALAWTQVGNSRSCARLVVAG